MTRIGALVTHPIQYYSPWFRHVAKLANLSVYYAHKQTAIEQGRAGFEIAFEWDVPLLDGYDWRWLENVSQTPGLERFGGCDTPEITAIIKRENFDAFVLFGWNKKCFLQAGRAAIDAGATLLIRLDSQLRTRRSALKRLAKWPLYAALLPRVAHYLSPGERSDAYLRHFLVPPNRIHRLPHMVDVTRFWAESERARSSGSARGLREKLCAGEDSFVFIMAAKLIPKKRPLLVLDALARLREVAPLAFARTRFWFAGDGPMRGQIESQVHSDNLPVSILGFINQSELPNVYAAADCLVLPSNETWGLVVNEALSCGLPAIVSDEAGCSPDLIIPGQTGWRFSRPEPEELARLFAVAMRDAPNMPRSAITDRADAGSFERGAARFLEIVASLPRPRRSAAPRRLPF